MAKSLERKLDELRKSIRKLDSALVACSGDVDNSFLMRICRQELGDKAVSLKALASVYPRSELSMARRIAHIMGTKQNVPEAPPPGRKMPSPQRSLHTYSSLKSLAMRTKMERAMKADSGKSGEPSGKGHSLILFRHAGLQSQILESNVSKAEIRLLAKELGLPNWERPLRDEKGALAKKSEIARRYLVSLGFKDARLTVRGRRVSICVSKDELVLLAQRSKSIIKKIGSLGFSETLMKLC
jgi:uncharacterized protein